jgi:hypothetical protein
MHEVGVEKQIGYKLIKVKITCHKKMKASPLGNCRELWELRVHNLLGNENQ